MENRPRVVFERLFGDSDTTDSATRRAQIQESRSILDSLVNELNGLRKQLVGARRHGAQVAADRHCPCNVHRSGQRVIQRSAGAGTWGEDVAD